MCPLSLLCALSVCYVPSQSVMCPLSLLCALSVCYVPTQSVMCPLSLLCAHSVCYVPFAKNCSDCTCCTYTVCSSRAPLTHNPHSWLLKRCGEHMTRRTFLIIHTHIHTHIHTCIQVLDNSGQMISISQEREFYRVRKTSPRPERQERLAGLSVCL
jgi:hypothetical protein